MIVEMPEIGQLVHAELLPFGMHGTDPAGGGNILVFITLRHHRSRVVIMTDEVVVIIDGP